MHFTILAFHHSTIFILSYFHITFTMIDKCELCPRRCGKRPGFCGAGDAPRVFRWGPHYGEEPPLTGERGSGCVFFSRCTMKCLYCQNSPWSWRGEGVD